MASHFHARDSGSALDFDDLFEPIGSSTPGPDTGLKHPSDGLDLSQHYFASIGFDQISFSTHWRTAAGHDVKNYFRHLGYDGTPHVTAMVPSYAVTLIDHTTPLVLVVFHTGDAPVTFQWKKNGSDISGETDSAFTISDVSVADAGNYSVTITNSLGSVTSSDVVVTVRQSPYIITQPTTITDSYGSGAHALTVVAGGDGLLYQWYKNGTALTGATGYQHVMNPLVYSDVAAYFCRVSSSYGAPYVDTDTVTVNVTGSLSITSQPSDLDVDDGTGPYALSVGATGYGTVAYQWYKDGVAMPGATGYQHVMNPVTSAANFGSYFCQVSDSSGASLNSDTVHVIAFPIIDVEPSDVGSSGSPVPDGTGPYAFHGDSHSSAGVSYQWWEIGLGGLPSILSGATGDQHVFFASAAKNGFGYFCQITDGNGVIRYTDTAHLYCA